MSTHTIPIEWQGDLETACTARLGHLLAECQVIGEMAVYDPDHDGELGTLDLWSCTVGPVNERGGPTGPDVFHSMESGCRIIGGPTARAIAEAILRAHQPPKADIERAVVHWLLTPHTGLSSRVMAATALNISTDGRHHPWDSADFHRCRVLLQSVPAVRESFPRIAAISDVWTALIARWDEIETAFADEYEHRRAPGGTTTLLMRRIIEDAERTT